MIRIAVAAYAVFVLAFGLSACAHPPPTPEQAYLKTIHTALDGRVVVYDDKIVTAGRAACALVPDPGISHSRLVAAAAKGIESNNLPDPFGIAEVIVSSAERNLCPTVHYATEGVLPS